MILGSPVALWLLLMGLPIIGFFFFRRRAVEVEVPSVVFWQRSAQLRYPTWLGRHFSRWATLLVQLLILLLLVLALSDPNPQGMTGHLIIVMDDSATMQTRETPEQNRFDIAKRHALAHLNLMPRHSIVSILLAGDPPTILADHEADRSRLEAGIRALTPRDVNQRLPLALKIAKVVAHEAAHILVLTDTPRNRLSLPVDAEWIQVGSYHPNVGITALRLADEGNELAVVVASRGFSGQAARLSLVSNESEIGSAEITLPDFPTEVRIPVTPSAGQPFTVRLELKDALPLDNTAFGVWPPTEAVRVRVATDDNLPLLAALDQPGVSLEIVARDAWIQHFGEDVDVTVLDAPSDAAPGARGRFIVLGGKDPFGFCTPLDSRADVKPTQWASNLPLLAALDLPTWWIRSTAGMGLGPCLESLVEADGLPLIIITMRGPSCPATLPEGFAAIYVNFDLSDSNLASQSKCSLPIFLWRAIDQLRGRTDSGQPLAYATGQPCSTTMKAGKKLILKDPSGAPCPASIRGDRVVVLRPERCGFYAARSDDSGQLLAFNWLPEEQYSGAGPTGATQVVARDDTPQFSSKSLHGWELCLVLAGIILLAETWLFHRHILQFS